MPTDVGSGCCGCADVICVCFSGTTAAPGAPLDGCYTLTRDGPRWKFTEGAPGVGPVQRFITAECIGGVYKVFQNVVANVTGPTSYISQFVGFTTDCTTLPATAPAASNGGGACFASTLSDYCWQVVGIAATCVATGTATITRGPCGPADGGSDDDDPVDGGRAFFADATDPTADDDDTDASYDAAAMQARPAMQAVPPAPCRFRSDDPHTVKDGTGRQAYTCSRAELDGRPFERLGLDVFTCSSCSDPTRRCGSLAACPGYLARPPEDVP